MPPPTGGRPAALDIAAVAQLPVADAPPPPYEASLPGIKESFSSLNFGTTEERIRAIQTIAEAARSGSEVARMRRALRLVAADADPEVAARAQEEYERLTERDDR
jgi:hypothetical protein